MDQKKSVTTVEIRKLNYGNVYSYIYQNRSTSKQTIAQALDLSLPTVSQNLQKLESLGLIERKGFYESTGGRKAQMICCVQNARISIGMTVLKESVHLVAIDLFGEAVGEAEKELPFKADENYYRTVGGFVNSFAASLPAEPSRILGVGIAIQGLVAADGGSIIYGTILNNGGMTCRDFQQYLDYPCRLIHDTEASATAELWKNDRIENAAYLVLNRNMGGVLIVNRAIYRGSVLGSGIVEHMTLRPDGARCYCGKHGCVEAYCSANSLRQRSGQPFDLFFQNLRAGEKRSEQIWAEYLRDLALAIDNIRMLADCQVILAGFLQQYLTEKDLEQLAGYVQKESAFPDMSIDIVMGKCGSHASTLGAGLHYIRHFLHQIGSAEKLPTEA